MASASWGLLGGLLLLVAQPAPAESVFVPPLDVGVYDDAGDYTPLRRDHTAGAYPPFYELRSFLAFDLSRVSGNVTGAKLHLRFSGYFGDDGETIALHEVTTPVAELVASGTGLVPVFDDLADGLLLGSKEVLRTQVAFVTHEIPLTPAALPLLQAALGGDFALGASVASLSGHAREQLSGCCLTLARLLELEGDLEVEPWPPPAHFGPHFAVIDFEFGVNTLPDDIPGVTFVSTPSTAPEPWFGGTASWGGRIFGAQHFGNLYSGDYSDLGIEFSPPVRSVGGWVRNVPAHSDEARSVETLRVSAWASSGQLLEERIVDLPAADAPPIFVDFTSPGGIARIEWSSDDVGRFGVDDVVYSGFAAAVPALGPGAHVLMMLSLVLAGALHRRW